MSRKLQIVLQSLSAIVAVCVLLAVCTAIDSRPKRRTVANIFIAASDSSDKAKIAADYHCDGTDDQVQWQAAIDEAATLGRTIIVSAGTYDGMTKAAGQTAAGYTGGTGDLSVAGSGRQKSVLDVSDTGATGFVAGKFVRISGGLRGGTETLEDDLADGVYSIDSVAGTDITLHHKPWSAAITWVGVDYRLLAACVFIPPNVTIKGEGHHSTWVELAANANCDMFHAEDTNGYGSWQLINLHINGNYTQQTCDVGDSNGLVVTNGERDVLIRDCAILSFKGDGMIHHGFSCLFDGRNIFEYNRRYGLVLTGTRNRLVSVNGRMNEHAALMLNQAEKNSILGGTFGTDEDTAPAILLRGARSNLFTGLMGSGNGDAWMEVVKGGDYQPRYNLAVGCRMYSKTGFNINCSTDALANNFVACTSDGATGITAVFKDVNGSNVFTPAVCYPLYMKGFSADADASRYRRVMSMLNGAGSALYTTQVVCWSATNADDTVVAPDTNAAFDPRHAGVVIFGPDNAARGTICVEGTCKAKVDGNAEGALDVNVAAGDFLTTNDHDVDPGYTYSYRKAATGQTPPEIAFAIALEAQTGEGPTMVMVIEPRPVD